MSSITSANDYWSAKANHSHRQQIYKENISSPSGGWISMWAAAGVPGAGSLSLSSATNGAIPTKALAGAFGFENSGSSRTLYFEQFNLDMGQNQVSYQAADRIFHGGSHLVNSLATNNYSSPPAFTRGTTDGSEVEIWLEIAGVIGAANATIAVKYLNQTGAAGTTPTININAWAASRAAPFPLAAGDYGVTGITGYIVGGSTTTGSVNILALRRLGAARGSSGSGFGSVLVQTGGLENMQPLSDDACLQLIALTGGSTSGPMMGSFQQIQG